MSPGSWTAPNACSVSRSGAHLRWLVESARRAARRRRRTVRYHATTQCRFTGGPTKSRDCPTGTGAAVHSPRAGIVGCRSKLCRLGIGFTDAWLVLVGGPGARRQVIRESASRCNFASFDPIGGFGLRRCGPASMAAGQLDPMARDRARVSSPFLHSSTTCISSSSPSSTTQPLSGTQAAQRQRPVARSSTARLTSSGGSHGRPSESHHLLIAMAGSARVTEASNAGERALRSWLRRCCWRVTVSRKCLSDTVTLPSGPPPGPPEMSQGNHGSTVGVVVSATRHFGTLDVLQSI
jgi:hypothetical protein